MKTSVILMALASILLFGCSTGINTVETANPQLKLTSVDVKRVIVDSALNKYAKVIAVNSEIVGGLLRVQATIANKTSEYRTANYQFEWFDKNGMRVQTPTSAWQTVALEGGEKSYINAVAPSKNATDFVLKLLPDVREY